LDDDRRLVRGQYYRADAVTSADGRLGYPKESALEIAPVEFDGRPVARRPTDDWVTREYMRLALAFLAFLSTLGLGWLVLTHQPLPAGDLQSSALSTVVFCLLVIACVLYVQRLPVLSFPSLFLAATFMFTCSPLLLYQFQGEEAFRDWEWIDVPSTLVAMPVIALAFSSFLLGAMVTSPPDPNGEVPATARHDHVDLDERVLRRLGYVLYAVAALLIAVASVSGGALTFAIDGGYHAFHGAKRAGEISQLAAVSLSRLLPWSLLILTATSNDRRSRRLVVLLAIPALAIMLAIGDRSGPLAATVVIACGLALRGSRISWRRSLGIALLIAFLMPMILNLRTIPISQWSGNVLEMAATNQVEDTNAYRENFLGGFLITTSGSYQTLMATVKVVPQEESYHYGSDYLSSLVVALPFRSIVLKPLDVDIRDVPPSQWVLSYLAPGRTAGPGYLQVAEAYLQFGALGVIALYVFMGWGLTRLWRFVASKTWDARTVAFSLIVMSETLIWVRNSSALAVRALVWGWVLVYVIPAGFGGRRSRPHARAARTIALPEASKP
jgi:oligosaccharide repeat unit polymerase